MILLEVFRTAGELLDMVRCSQRAELHDRGVDVISLDITGLSMTESIDRYNRTVNAGRPHAQLIRGAEVFDIIPLNSRLPTFFDHSTPCPLGKTTPLKQKLEYVRRSFCYSLMARDDLLAARTHKVSLISGPFLPQTPTPLPERTVVAVLRSCSTAQSVLREIAHIREKAHLDIDIVSTMKAPGVETVVSAFEAARRCSLIVAPMEDVDYGQPHMGGVLALSTCKALATTRTSALESMPYPSGSFISVLKDAPRAYGIVATTYSSNPGFATWPQKVQYDAENATKVLVEYLRTET